MTGIPLSGNLARNAILFALAGAGLGWLFYSCAYSAAGGKVAGLIEKATGESRPPRVIPRKMTAAEPMAGYGA
jgi:hypothetical protein